MGTVGDWSRPGSLLVARPGSMLGTGQPGSCVARSVAWTRVAAYTAGIPAAAGVTWMAASLIGNLH